MDRTARWPLTLVVLGCLAAPVAADPGEVDRLLKQGFPDRDYSRAPIKILVPGHRCVLAATGLTFDPEGTAILTDAAVVRVRTVGKNEVVEAASGRSAKVTFDPPVKKADELGKSKIVSVETSDGRVIRLAPKSRPRSGSMFKELGQMVGMMKNLPKLQAAMAEMQQKLGQISVEGNAGAGMVVVTANGRMELTRCLISDEAMKLNDKDMLADLVIAATNMALAKAREEVAKASQAVAADAGLPLPPGMLPGM